MVMDPNKNSQNPPVTPGDSSRTVHLSPPLPGDHTILGDYFIRKRFEEMKRASGKLPPEWLNNIPPELAKKSSSSINFHEIPSPLNFHEMSSSNVPPELLEEMSPSINFSSSWRRVVPDPPRFKLLFINKVQNPSFTATLVRGDDGYPIKVAIRDEYTQSSITSDNSLSSAKVSLTVLNAEFVENKGETLSRGVFNQSVLKERERKGPILTGRSCIIELENRVGTFDSIFFNDNSSWTKNGFRLGVTVVSDGEEGYFNGARVLEGVSGPFRVKDRRVKASQKPDRLELSHSVRCIKKIGKDRASSLQKKNINIVENFLELFYNNPSELREILCIKSETSKEWDSMIEHVMQCANEYNALNNNSQPRQALVRPMEENLFLSTNGGIGWESSEPNPPENDIIDDYLNF